MGQQGDDLTPDIRRNWNSLMTLFIWAALLAINEDGFEIKEISIR